MHKYISPQEVALYNLVLLMHISTSVTQLKEPKGNGDMQAAKRD